MVAEAAGAGRRYLAIGGLGGLAGGLLGVGGGFLMVPLQILWTATPPRRASGNSLAAIVPLGIVAAAIYYVGGGQLDLVVAAWVVVGSTLGAIVGSQVARFVPERWLELLVAVLMLAGAANELYDAGFGAGGAALEGPTQHAAVTYLFLVGLGAVIGILSGLTGVGGGILLVPALVLGFALGQRVAQGTSLIAILPGSAVGAALHARNGDFDGRAAGRMVIGAVPASLVGALLALWLPQRALAGLFGLLLVAVAVRLARTGAVTRPAGPDPQAGSAPPSDAGTRRSNPG